MIDCNDCAKFARLLGVWQHRALSAEKSSRFLQRRVNLLEGAIRKDISKTGGNARLEAALTGENQ